MPLATYFPPFTKSYSLCNVPKLATIVAKFEKVIVDLFYIEGFTFVST